MDTLLVYKVVGQQMELCCMYLYLGKDIIGEVVLVAQGCN